MRRWPTGPTVAAAVLTASIAAAAPGHAQLTTFTSRAAFAAAAGPLVTQGFDTPFAPVPVAGGAFAFPGVTATFDANHGGMTIGGGDVLVDLHPAGMGVPQFLRFEFAAPVTAFGASVGPFDDPAILLRAVVGGTTVDVAEGFFGVVSTTPFTTVELRDPTDLTFLVVDDLAFSASAVPEPGTLTLVLVGLVAAARGARHTLRRGREHA